MINRQTYNRWILGKLEEIINKYPDLRFGQILVNTGIIQLNYSEIINEVVSAKDPFNEEPKITWERIKDYDI